MMDKELLDGLKNFDEVWKRVQASKPTPEPKSPDTKLMPRKTQKCRGQRFLPPKP